MNSITRSPWLFICGLLGGSAVALGAVAAHAISDATAAAALERASTYQLLHAIAILATLPLAGWLCAASRWLMLLGVMGFSGAIYAKYLLNLPAMGGIAPIGGSILILSWLVLAAAQWSQYRRTD
jgi:uncharacterized membrane protein YgdD (TMEM256/DUF423 family)